MFKQLKGTQTSHVKLCKTCLREHAYSECQTQPAHFCSITGFYVSGHVYALFKPRCHICTSNMERLYCLLVTDFMLLCELFAISCAFIIISCALTIILDAVDINLCIHTIIS